MNRDIQQVYIILLHSKWVSNTVKGTHTHLSRRCMLLPTYGIEPYPQKARCQPVKVHQLNCLKTLLYHQVAVYRHMLKSQIVPCIILQIAKLLHNSNWYVIKIIIQS